MEGKKEKERKRKKEKAKKNKKKVGRNLRKTGQVKLTTLTVLGKTVNVKAERMIGRRNFTSRKTPIESTISAPKESRMNGGRRQQGAEMRRPCVCLRANWS